MWYTSCSSHATGQAKHMVKPKVNRVRNVSHFLTRRGKYYLWTIMQFTTVTQLTSSCANIQTWWSSNEVCILHPNILFHISKKVKSNRERKIPALCLLFCIQCGIKIDNCIEPMKPDNSRLPGATVLHQLYVQLERCLIGDHRWDK